MTPWPVAVLALAAIPSVAQQPVPTGTVTVAITEESAIDPDEQPAFVEAVGRAMSNADFVVLPAGGPSRYAAIVTLARRESGVVTAPGGQGGMTVRAANWGAGMRATLPSKKQLLHGLVVTTMTIRLVNRRDDHQVWTGSALTAQVDGTAAGSPAEVGRKLASALVARFPAPLPETISVP